MLDERDIVEMLQLRGSDQEQLFAAARDKRHEVFGDEVVVRGVTEIANHCRVNCQFCPMRRENTRHNEGFRLTVDDLVDAGRTVHANDINVVFFQGGEIPQTTRVVGEALPKIHDLYHGDVEILLNLGNKSHDEYAYLRDQGATSYIIKHETSDPGLNERMRFETLESRLDCMRDLLDLGYWVGTGAIVGLPGQSLASIARDILLARDIGAHMCSMSPFVPAPDTPLAGQPPGDVEVTLNALAASRLVEPNWLIPSVSALAKNQKGGQYRGFAAGANVMTVNFTPTEQRDRYLIYGKDRFVVRRDYATGLIASTGLRPRKSVFAGRTPARRKEFIP
ncbi:radical SAM protein [Kibdelosporangium persicum]|uniref:[FeFe] hydrogenase H-cluster radical SAM maturase HydE n=1 Tax=Kibdelosporangium persicum TaxID=2698649 RepID=A0ABX2FDX9_9PSEU|nr:radical SAM protein [Kibdelosporangium persicum]NRN69423.1 [FeFe] hydrogenase H-cluster radical SAM maturase HydE [Kibdelosporangium persicum]